MLLTTFTETARCAANYQIVAGNRKDMKGQNDRIERSLAKEQDEQSEICMRNNK